jgi:protein-S-isoprenylcysteine O-methyltransferase Ste14
VSGRIRGEAGLSIRALAAFLACPGVVAGLIPWMMARGAPQFGPHRGLGLVPLGLGACCLALCVRDFFVSGRGTLAPWDPPRALVVAGLHRYVRNPMYLSVVAIVLGWSLYFGSYWLALYLAVLAIGFHIRVRLHEEPWLRRQFGPDWERYRAAVPRWIPRLRAR